MLVSIPMMILGHPKLLLCLVLAQTMVRSIFLNSGEAIDDCILKERVHHYQWSSTSIPHMAQQAWFMVRFKFSLRNIIKYIFLSRITSKGRIACSKLECCCSEETKGKKSSRKGNRFGGREGNEWDQAKEVWAYTAINYSIIEFIFLP